MHELDRVPERVRQPAEAAVAWINTSQNRHYELTGVVEVDDALKARDRDSFELGVVLCDGEICDRQQVVVQPTDAGFEFQLAPQRAREIPPLLDPPVGVRSQWLDQVLARHEFVMLLFYRGLW